MPQLDKVTFLSQFFWLCFFYLGFYSLVFQYFLPKISRILTLRQKKMNLSQDGFNSLQQEKKQVPEKLDNNISRVASLSNYVLNDLIYRKSNWLNQSQTDVNKIHYKTVNNSYIHNLGDAFLSKDIKLYQASTDSEKPEFLKVNKIKDNIQNLIKNLIKAPISISQVKVIRGSSPLKNKGENPPILTQKKLTIRENNKRSKKNKKDIK